MLSVVVPTFERRARLARVMERLGQQSLSPDHYEVIVVDDGSRDGTAQWLRQRAFPFRFQMHWQANGGPARARNTGVRAARGEYLLFIDDDVVPAPELLEEHLRAHEQGPRDVVVLGPLCSLPRYDQPWVAWEQFQLEKQYAAMARGDWSPTYRQFWTGNASVRREHVLAVGLFDERCLRGEDVELGWRLSQRGLTFLFNPRARGFHHAERSLESFCRAHEAYGGLEVEIFGRVSSENTMKILGSNFRRLQPLQRQLIANVVARPVVRRQLERALRRYLETSLARKKQDLARPACSLLANVLYWQASAKALGAAGFAEVKRRAQSKDGLDG